MIWFVAICVLVGVTVIVYYTDQEDNDHLSQPMSNNIKEDFINNYQWCVDNLTLKCSSMLIEDSDTCKTTDFNNRKWEWTFPRSLHDYWGIRGFRELHCPAAKVKNGSGWSCTGVVEFVNEFNSQVESIRSRLDPEEVSLLKKYDVSYKKLLTYTPNNTYTKIQLDEL